MSFWISVFVFFGWIHRSGKAGSYCSSIFNFGGPSLLFSTVAARVPLFTHPHPHFLSIISFMTVVLTGLRWYLIVVSTCISMMIGGICPCVCWQSIYVFFFFFFFFKQVAAPAAYGGSQARGQATATVEATPSSYVVSHTGSPIYVFWGNTYSDPLPILKLHHLVIWYWVLRNLHTFWILTPYQIDNLQISSSIQ